MLLTDKILNLKQNTSRITTNPILDVFNLNYCKVIDEQSKDDSFYFEKKESILNYLKNVDVDFDENLLSALHEYNEIINFYLLKQKLELLERIKESNKEKQPDFKVNYSNQDVFIEMKTLGFSGGNLNYKNVIEEGLNNQIDIEKQISDGKKIAMGYIAISPLEGDSSSVKYLIETVIKKINQNIKKGQFTKGPTILLIDLSLLLLFSTFKNESVPIYQEDIKNSMVSGALWNIAFGKKGDNIFKSIEFEGKENIEGTLEQTGILNMYDFIDAISFRVYGFNKQENSLVSFSRYKDENNIFNILYDISDFVNDERNSYGYAVLQEVNKTLERNI